MKNLLLIFCTHGNESKPLTALKKIIQQYGQDNFLNKCDYIIANPKALEKNIRFTETDLNRIYPGDSNSKIYEEKRASEVLEYAKKFKFVIDFHTTTADSGIFTIITKDTENNRELAMKLLPKRVVIWESTSGRKTGPITSLLDSACEIECSVSYEEHLEDLEKSILGVLNILDKKINKKEWFRVVDNIPKSEASSFPGIKDFSLITYKNKSLYPIFVEQYNDKVCYLMEKINI